MRDESTSARVCVVTGVSRRAGIGFAVTERLLADGARVLVHSWTAHDAEQPWGADAGAPGSVIEALAAPQGCLAHLEADLGDPDASRLLIDCALEAFGALDVLVVNHARSSSQDLASVTVEELDRCWAVNARATVLLVQAFAARRDRGRPDGRVVLFTSGQHLEPMPGELPYAITKERFPAGRWGRPRDIAPVVAWLASPQSAWVTGQVLDVEGGFRRSSPAASAGVRAPNPPAAPAPEP